MILQTFGNKIEFKVYSDLVVSDYDFGYIRPPIVMYIIILKTLTLPLIIIIDFSMVLIVVPILE